MSKRFNWGTKILGLVAVASLSLGLATPARAAIVNGGFEDFPDFNGWVTVGNTTIQGTDFHATVEGSLQALLSTTGTGGGTPLNAAALETFVGLSAGQLSTAHNATNGSAICQMFTATEGQTLTVHFDFLTNEPKLIIREELLAGAAVTSNNDFGFLTLKKDSDATSLQILADTNSTMVPTNPLDGANSYLFHHIVGWNLQALPRRCQCRRHAERLGSPGGCDFRHGWQHCSASGGRARGASGHRGGRSVWQAASSRADCLIINKEPRGFSYRQVFGGTVQSASRTRCSG